MLSAHLKWLCPPLLSTQIKKSLAKFALYQKFTNSLAVSVLLSVAWIGYEVVQVLAIFTIIIIVFILLPVKIV